MKRKTFIRRVKRMIPLAFAAIFSANAVLAQAADTLFNAGTGADFAATGIFLVLIVFFAREFFKNRKKG